MSGSAARRIRHPQLAVSPDADLSIAATIRRQQSVIMLSNVGFRRQLSVVWKEEQNSVFLADRARLRGHKAFIQYLFHTDDMEGVKGEICRVARS